MTIQSGLAKFAATFHQDWIFDFSNPQSGLIRFCRSYGRTASFELRDELDELAHLTDGEEQARNRWEDATTSMDPNYFGMSWRQWFDNIRVTVDRELAGDRLHALKKLAATLDFSPPEFGDDEAAADVLLSHVVTWSVEEFRELVDDLQSLYLENVSWRVAEQVWIDECRAVFDPRPYDLDCQQFLFWMESVFHPILEKIHPTRRADGISTTN